MRSTFVQCLIEQSRIDPRIFVILPDMGFSVFEKYQEEFPDRIINVGIAEQNAIGVAAGLALAGKKVYVYSIIPFITMRSFEQVRVDVAYMNTQVRLVGVGAGLTYGPAGATHHAIEDIAIMRSLPNMTVCCPGDPHEVKNIMKYSFDYQGPMYIRLAKNNEPKLHLSEKPIIVGEAACIAKGNDIAIIATSTMLMPGFQIVNDLKNKGIKATLISMHTIKPIDKKIIIKLISKHIPIITLEEHTIYGGLGSAVAEVIAENGKSIPFARIGINDIYTHTVGSQNYLKKKLGLDNESIFNKCMELIKFNKRNL